MAVRTPVSGGSRAEAVLQPGEDTELTTNDAELAGGPELAVGGEPAGSAAAGVALAPGAWPARSCAVPEQPAHARITANAATMRARMTRCYACPPGPRG
jgi:hypothetical protein